MGYKTPNICKEVYLFIHDSFLKDRYVSLEEYQKEYGIDLNDIFKLTIEETGPDTMGVRAELRPLIKLYFVREDVVQSAVALTQSGTGSVFYYSEFGPLDMDHGMHLDFVYHDNKIAVIETLG